MIAITGGHAQSIRETIAGIQRPFGIAAIETGAVRIQQRVFARLSVFAGGFTGPATLEVCADELVDAERVPELLASPLPEELPCSPELLVSPAETWVVSLPVSRATSVVLSGWLKTQAPQGNANNRVRIVRMPSLRKFLWSYKGRGRAVKSACTWITRRRESRGSAGVGRGRSVDAATR